MTRRDMHSGVAASRLVTFYPPVIFRSGIFAAIVFTVGCGGGKANVAGKVIYKGKPLAVGTVSMVGPDGIVRQGAIKPDGTYSVTDVAAGKVQIGVLSRNPAGDTRGGRRPAAANRVAAPPAGGPGDASSWFAIPSSYQEPTTSGLSTVLSRGSNKYDIDLQ
jgi:hypothetical protein